MEQITIHREQYQHLGYLSDHRTGVFQHDDDRRHGQDAENFRGSSR